MMNPWKFLPTALLIVRITIGAGAQEEVTAVRSGSRIDVMINKTLFTSYIISQEEKYPYFFPVNGPSGASVTSVRNANYPHHSSLFFGCDKVNGGNFWQEGLEQGQIMSTRADIVVSGGNRVIIENECIWTRPGADAPVRDKRRIAISAPSGEIYQIDFDIELEMLEDVTINRTNHSLFSARMDADLAVINGGIMINAEGEMAEKGTFGKASGWISCHGNRLGKTEGMAIMQHPANKWYPAPWFTRDYGFFSPTPMYWPADPDEGTVLRKGEKVNLRYRVLVHSGNHREADIAGQYKKYTSEHPERIK